MYRSARPYDPSCPCCQAAKVAYGVAVACAMLSAPAWAQEVAPQLLEEVVIQYPHHAEGAHDDVVVRVTVDATGHVIEAEWVEGLEVFRAESLRAAKGLHFAPATRDGKPVGASVLVTFHFEPPIAPIPGVDEGEAIVVNASAIEDRYDTHSRITLTEAELERAAGEGLAEAVSQVPGVTLSQGTADAAKPILRGQSERRLLLLYDGARHESQKWGPDHAPEIDPFSAGSISVIKGAAGVRYGPDAIGGVLLALMLDQPMWGEGPVRILIIAPFFVMPTVSALVWKNMFMNPVNGLFAHIAKFFGMEPVAFLSEIPLLSIILIVAWQWLPFATLILLTALQSLDREQMEAAEMDGAPGWARFVYITLPHMARAITVVILIQTIFLLSVFAEILVTTNGGPGYESTNIAYLVYAQSLLQFDVGGGSAGGIIAVILANIVAIFLMRMIGKNLDA